MTDGDSEIIDVCTQAEHPAWTHRLLPELADFKTTSYQKIPSYDLHPYKMSVYSEGPNKSPTLKLKNSHDEEPTQLPLGADTLSLYERKALLVNREFDAMGLGRYQKVIWLLCGFGYLLDLMWAEAFGLVAGPNIFTAFSAGLTVGAFTWGLLVDIIGRKWAFNLTCLITSVFGLLLAAPTNYNGICVITALCGFGLGGNIPIDATIVIEFLPQNRRWLLPLLSIFQPIGVVLTAVIAFGLVPKYRCDVTLPSCRTVAEGVACCTRTSNLGWRYLMIVLGAITLSVFIVRFAIFTFHESPKFLLARGRDAEAVEIVHRIAAFNRQPVPKLQLSDFQEIDQEFGEDSDLNRRNGTTNSALDVLKQAFGRFKHLKGLFRTRLLGFTTVLLWIVYMGDFWSFNLAGSFLPIILARRGQTAGQSVTETYRQYIYIYLPGILGTILAAAAVELPGIGRKWSLVFGALVQGVSMAMYTQVTTIKASVGLNALEYIMQSFFNAVLYGFTPEVFEAPYRGSAAGLCSTFGRLAGIVAPIAARPFIDGNSNGVLWLACGGIFVSAFFLVFLPIETRHRASY
ncbi:hypothetical protein P7C70_g7589, partial [Phenoliferia sp. Uapishka_3]